MLQTLDSMYLYRLQVTANRFQLVQTNEIISMQKNAWNFIFIHFFTNNSHQEFDIDNYTFSDINRKENFGRNKFFL